MGWLILIALIALACFLYFRFFKVPHLKTIVFCDGGLGAGKTSFTLHIALKLLKRSRRKWRVKCFLARLLHKEKPEEPMLYSNIPLKYVKHVPLTADLLLRKTRFAFGSVVFVDDMSQVFDQFDFKDPEINNALRDFFKLFRHEIHGNKSQGFFVANSQSTKDLHFTFKSVLTDYLYIHHMTKLGLFNIIKCQELMYSNDEAAQNIMNVNQGDVEDNLKSCFLPFTIFKKYDSWCYSGGTDGLPIEDHYKILGAKDSLKVDRPLTLRKRREDRK